MVRLMTPPTPLRTAKQRASDPELDIRLLIARIHGRLHAADANATQVAIKARLGKTAVHDILSGKNKNPSVPVIRRIALALGTTLSYLTGETDNPEAGLNAAGVAPIPVAGIAETGAFRPMPEIGPELEHELPRVNAPTSRAFPGAKHFALEIRGDSMNAAKPVPLVEGMFALCVDFTDAELTLETGRIYAVRRTQDGGHTYEVTIKRAHVFRDRVELRPESTNKKHETIIVPRARGDDLNAQEVRAIGLVYGTFSSMEL